LAIVVGEQHKPSLANHHEPLAGVRGVEENGVEGCPNLDAGRVRGSCTLRD